MAERLQALMDEPGIAGCALVETETGLIWLSSGEVPDERIWESAMSYWRLHQRQHTDFLALGPLGAAVMYHQHGVLAVLPCCANPSLLMVTLAEHRGVDWLGWQKRVRELGRFIRAEGQG